MEALLLIERNTKELLEAELRRSGLMYRIFSRVKDVNSVQEKIKRKNYNDSKLMTDIIGFRITTYFNDDVNIISDYFEQKLSIFDNNYDELKPNVFEPIRKNLTCNMEAGHCRLFDELRTSENVYKYTANTYEIQFRTTLSEGWHEVEHNMRYKCKNEWDDLPYENRIFNGIYAAVESLDHSMKSMFDDLAYSHYRNRNWEAMIRNAFRLRFLLSPLNENICKILSDNDDLSKKVFKTNRNEILKIIIHSGLRMSFHMDNLIYLLNYLIFRDEDLNRIAPVQLIEDFDLYLKDYPIETLAEKQTRDKNTKTG
jgi:ppGpp synthetase/RelA/SpoT-type nucleotidyltranferase